MTTSKSPCLLGGGIGVDVGGGDVGVGDSTGVDGVGVDVGG